MASMGFNFIVLVEFLIYNIIWIELPGLLLADMLFTKKYHWATKCLSGYVLGFSLLAAEYYVECVCHITGMITFFNPVLAAFIIITWLINGRKIDLPEDGQVRAEQITIFVMLLIFAFIAFQAKWAGALKQSSIQMNHDLLYHVGNIVTLSHGVPAMDPRVGDIEFYYHYFYDLIFAMCKHMFGMDAYSLLITGMPLIVAWPMGLAMIILGERIYIPDTRDTSDDEGFDFKYFFACTGMLVSCVVIYPINVIASFVPLSWPNDHFFTNYNSMGITVAVFILAFEYLVSVWQDEFDFKNMIVICLITAVVTGCKGPSGVMLIAITIAVWVSEGYIEKKWTWAKVGYVISEITGFLACYIVVVAGFGGTGGNNRAVRLSAEGTLTASRVAQIFYKYLGIDPFAFPLVLLIAVLIAVCLIGPGILSLIGFCTIKTRDLVKNNRVGDIYDWFSIGTIIIAVCGCLMMTIEGFSQGYMVVTAVPCFFYVYMRYLQQGNIKLIKGIQYLTFGLGTILLIGDISYYSYDDMFVESGYTYETDELAWVTPEEMEGYLWIRDNTPEDSLVASDRQSENIDHRATFFYVDSFAERQVFLEGHSYSNVSEDTYNRLRGINGSFFSKDEERALAAFEEQCIDYIVVHKRIHPDYVKASNRMILEFDNEDISVYKYE
mgnify:CR=1 FL=1